MCCVSLWGFYKDLCFVKHSELIRAVSNKRSIAQAGWELIIIMICIQQLAWQGGRGETLYMKLTEHAPRKHSACIADMHMEHVQSKYSTRLLAAVQDYAGAATHPSTPRRVSMLTTTTSDILWM